MLIRRVAGRLSQPISLANSITSSRAHAPAEQYARSVIGYLLEESLIIASELASESEAGILILNLRANTHVSPESS